MVASWTLALAADIRPADVYSLAAESTIRLSGASAVVLDGVVLTVAYYGRAHRALGRAAIVSAYAGPHHMDSELDLESAHARYRPADDRYRLVAGPVLGCD